MVSSVRIRASKRLVQVSDLTWGTQLEVNQIHSRPLHHRNRVRSVSKVKQPRMYRHLEHSLLSHHQRR